jgi:hypothetical protein
METYEIIIGETGNERGHLVRERHISDDQAIRRARHKAGKYKGDGWWRVVCAGTIIAHGGRK